MTKPEKQACDAHGTAQRSSFVFAPVLLAVLLGCGGAITFEDKTPLVFTAPKPPEPEPAAESTPPPVEEIGERIQFSFNSAKLAGDALKRLSAVVEALETNPGFRKIQVEGHASEEGGDDLNQLLSDARARAVRAYLIAKGIAANRLVSKGFGEQNPIADNDSESGRERNRRVEFKVLEEK
jgi:outer membrane protein OmpA-like peptidoglycan-associated protein